MPASLLLPAVVGLVGLVAVLIAAVMLSRPLRGLLLVPKARFAANVVLSPPSSEYGSLFVPSMESYIIERGVNVWSDKDRNAEGEVADMETESGEAVEVPFCRIVSSS